jgi:hypothetical protein
MLAPTTDAPPAPFNVQPDYLSTTECGTKLYFLGVTQRRHAPLLMAKAHDTFVAVPQVVDTRLRVRNASARTNVGQSWTYKSLLLINARSPEVCGCGIVLE